MNNTELTIDQLKMISGSEMGPNGMIGKYNDLTEFYVHNAERWGIENGFYNQLLNSMKTGTFQENRSY